MKKRVMTLAVKVASQAKAKSVIQTKMTTVEMKAHLLTIKNENVTFAKSLNHFIQSLSYSVLSVNGEKHIIAEIIKL